MIEELAKHLRIQNQYLWNKLYLGDGPLLLKLNVLKVRPQYAEYQEQLAVGLGNATGRR